MCVRVVRKSGNISEHLLFCTRALSATTEQFLSHIADELERLAVPCDNLVAQTYDEISNMLRRYNGLQAKFKELAGEEHKIFVHCYAYILTRVLDDTASTSLVVAKLFENLQTLYVMVSKFQPIYQDCKEEMQLPIRSLKRISTVILMLQKIATSTAFDAGRRYTADGMRNLFSTKQFMANAYLFREIFAMTGPLSRILQGVNIDFGKALNFLDAALEQLLKLRSDPQKIIHAVEENFDGIEWEEKRISRSRRMPGELAQDEPATSAEENWRHEVFYAAADPVIAEINGRFSSSRHVLEAFSIFSPKAFSTFSEVYPTTGHVEENVKEFCETYKIDSHRCAVGLYSFATAFKIFNFDTVENKTDHADYGDVSDEFSDSIEDTDDE